MRILTRNKNAAWLEPSVRRDLRLTVLSCNVYFHTWKFYNVDAGVFLLLVILRHCVCKMSQTVQEKTDEKGANAVNIKSGRIWLRELSALFLKCAHGYVQTKGQFQMSSSIVLLHILRQGFSLNLELTNSARLAGHWDNGTLLSLLPHSFNYRYIPEYPIFTFFLGNRLRSLYLHLCNRSFTKLSCLPTLVTITFL